MAHKTFVIEQCQIDEFEQTGTDFMRDILGKDYARVLVSDISDLSDFTFSGTLPEGALDTSLGLKQITANWDKWVMAKIYERYGITLSTTVVNLVGLFHQIEQLKNARVH
jgi:hypothetical protein